MNYYKRHLGDYAKDTRHLSTYQHGVYALLLDWYYANERAIPIDIAYRIVQARTGPERASVNQVLTSFFDMSKEPGFAHSKRANEDISKYQTKAATNRLNRNGSGVTNGQRVVEEMDDESSTNGPPSHKPLTTSHKEEQKQKSPPAAAFDFKADLFDRWKSMPGSGGGAFLNKLFRDHKPEQRVVEAVEATLAETRADPKAFVLGVLAKSNEKPLGSPMDSHDVDRLLAAQDFTGCI